MNRKRIVFMVVVALLQAGFSFGAYVTLRSASRDGGAAGSSAWAPVLAAAALVCTAAAWGMVAWVLFRVAARQRETVRLQRRFVADISHELKTPLALVRLLAETLRDGRVSDPPRVHEYHTTITREAERLSALLENILDYSRIESGQKQYEQTDCDIDEVARQAWRLFEPQFAGDGFTAELEIEDDLPAIRGDPQALGQLMINLLQNAHRYSGDTKFVRLTVGREPENIVITVEDHGIGMSRSQTQRLGDSFYRAPDPRVRKTRGTGLGHAIIKHIITAHNGKLGVYSHPSLGSTFVVRLPLPAPDA